MADSFLERLQININHRSDIEGDELSKQIPQRENDSQ
jgi:hypothetical protein